MDPGVPALLRSLVRARFWLLVLAIGLPAGYLGLVERHARRLEMLGEHGVSAIGEVTRVQRDWFAYA